MHGAGAHGRHLTNGQRAIKLSRKARIDETENELLAAFGRGKVKIYTILEKYAWGWHQPQKDLISTVAILAGTSVGSFSYEMCPQSLRFTGFELMTPLPDTVKCGADIHRNRRQVV
jgi:hypothetical protein